MGEPDVFARRRLHLLFRSGLPLVLAAAIGLVPTTTAAQTLYGSITGIVTDVTTAAVPGVRVSVKDEATGLELTAVTDATGTYAIRNIAGGIYTLRVELQGFKEFVQTGIPITAGGIVRINAHLEIGARTESVTVSAEVAVLKTEK